MSLVYLLTPRRAPENGKRIYIGKTSRGDKIRLKEHNGIRRGGAKKTRKYRPWMVVATVSGFASDNDALKFEWIWQHPYESRITKKYLKEQLVGKRGFGGLYTVKRKLIEIKLIIRTFFPYLKLRIKSKKWIDMLPSIPL